MLRLKQIRPLLLSKHGPHNLQSLQISVNFRSIVEILIEGWITIDGDKGKIRGVDIELDL